MPTPTTTTAADTSGSSAEGPRVNVADRLATVAIERPDALALVAAKKRGGFNTITYAELDHDATQLALGLQAMGIGPGKRIVMLVRPGIEFVTLVFALLRSGATMVLVDAGLGRENIVRCLASTAPDGFVAIPLGHVMRLVKRRRFPNAKLNVTVGRKWLWGGETLASLRRLGEEQLDQKWAGKVVPDSKAPSPQSLKMASPENGGGGFLHSPPRQGEGLGEGENTVRPTELLHSLKQIHPALPHTTADDPAAIIFTSGSTGPPKGVLYQHETFATQAAEIQNQYGLDAGGIDLACFPLFGLFNVACGVTTVFPDMDFSRPAACDPLKLIAAANEWQCTQAFASPAVWDKLSQHCATTGDHIPTLRNVFSCGAPVTATVMQRTLAAVHPDAQMHTPYGATESLPVATIEAAEVIAETTDKTDQGAGVCVGRRFDTIDWRMIRITDEPISSIEATKELPTGEIGELIVRGPQVSREYFVRPGDEHDTADRGVDSHNKLAKIHDGETVWHRIGDVGYFDDQQRFWYCGRKSQRVVTPDTTLYTECVEQLANTVEGVRRTALVGLGQRPTQQPVLIIELDKQTTATQTHIETHVRELLAQHACSDTIKNFLFHPQLPVDIRHNAKIFREKLAVWAAEQPTC